MEGGDNDGIASRYALSQVRKLLHLLAPCLLRVLCPKLLHRVRLCLYPIPTMILMTLCLLSTLLTPTYDQIAEYQKSILGMARGGEVESALGGNEKDLINDAEKAIRGELDETRAAIILAQYVQQYGEDALRDSGR